MAKLEIMNDPFVVLLAAVQNLYPEIECEIQLDPTIKKPFKLFGKRLWGHCGCTLFPDDGGIPQIRLSSNIPYFAVVEILAHELAHVVAGIDAGHGEEWEEAFKKIHAEYDICFAKRLELHK